MNRLLKVLKISRTQHFKPKLFRKNHYRPSPHKYYVLGMNRWFKLPKYKRSTAKTTLSLKELLIAPLNKMALFFPETSQYTADDHVMTIIPVTSYPKEEEDLLMISPYVGDDNAISDFDLDEYLQT